APDEVSGKIVTGEADIAAAPINLAAALYNKTEGKVAIIAVNTLGVLYVLENGETVNSIADLSGKTLYATGQGATPEFVLNYLLEKNGVDGKVDVQYMADHAELAALLAADEGGVKIAMLPEPNVTAALLKNSSLRIALDLTEEWNKVSGGAQLVQGCLIARKDVLENNPDAVNAFLEEYAAATAFVNEKPDDAAALIEKYGIMASAAAAKTAIPNCNIVCVTGEDMQADALAMLQVLFAADPKSVGGKLPGDDFYYLP
ncbi:MAG: ABC transporter substrate-binding protein, partial [Bacillota bacterium]